MLKRLCAQFLVSLVLLFPFQMAAAAQETVNDITQLNPIAVERVIAPTSVAEISQLVGRHNGPISIGGGRYSQGGQTACENCLFIDMRQMNRVLSLDVARKQITVEAGISWRAVQEVIDPENLSMRIMQSFSNFTVGGSLSVNAHGRYVGEGPLVRSVDSIKMVLADGSVVTASRTENSQQFFGAIGGYGGVGVIVEATLNLTDNVPVERVAARMKVTDYKAWFFENIRGSKTAVFHNATLYPSEYSDLNVITISTTDKSVDIPDRLAPPNPAGGVKRSLIAWLSNGALGKQVKQYIYDPAIYTKPRVAWRNYEASMDVASIEPASREKATYVLQEYFIPVEHFDEFVPRLRTILSDRKVNVLNVSIRHALPDKDTLLSWAPTEVFSIVIYYQQGTTEADKQVVGAWTRELIGAALDNGGRYYLPYQIHATREQFLKAYERAPEYFELKQRVDPNYKFRNKLWEAYYRP
ncbi:FAD-binding oxidoreductase [Asticcacaulis sp. ZE23SCel15]|uniref:FAD-dependent oxidoreductase n=1 Tax=Asticcacaulis sp. ZE23SCel15 TaxID=3059027 RepID=UPI00265E4507|nr:FAD-binding oxidoreductase [Asticcacaulis sp. ZE23SCel15]WKL55855.1 FAD-binding oxidoreductase [Asticcacaulis sp. ZE23SCel15]